MRTQQNSGS